MVSKHSFVLITLATLLTAALVPSGSALDKSADGITALITFEGGNDLALVQDESGAYSVSVSVFQKDGIAWEQISLGVSLRVFEDTPLGAEDRVSKYFLSSALEPVTVSFPADAVGNGTIDVFVTFSALGGNPVPTSHYQIAKNVALSRGQYNLADQFDHHSTRVLAL